MTFGTPATFAVVMLMTAFGFRAMIVVAMGFVAAGIALPSVAGIGAGLWLYVGAMMMGPDDDPRNTR